VGLDHGPASSAAEWLPLFYQLHHALMTGPQGHGPLPQIAIFRQINKNEPHTHHDALEFSDGQIVLLTRVSEGQEATVLQLPAYPVSAAEMTAQERDAHVG
jgi:uncharacterized iron-regulated membrane protein